MPGRRKKFLSRVEQFVVHLIWPHATERPHRHDVTEPLYRMYLEQAVSRGFVAVDTFNVDDRTIQIHGKLIAPFGLDARYGVSVGGISVDLSQREYSPALSELCGVGKVYLYRIDAATADLVSGGGTVLVQGHPGGSGAPVAEQTFAIPLTRPTLPDTARRLRVHGTEEESSYLIQGATAAWKIRSVLCTHFGRALGDLQRVLDWGCGCGRVLQHLLADRGTCELHGCDVDHDNIDWCRANIPHVAFAKTEQQPPLPYGDETFDLVFGISVLTHLGREAERIWVGELHRVLKPSGIALLSVHGALTQLWHKPPNIVENLRANAFMDAGENADFAHLMADPSLYRDVIHTPKAIQSVWGPRFEIVDILPGYIGSLQDLVVLQRRA